MYSSLAKRAGAVLLLALLGLPVVAAQYLTYRDGAEEYARGNFDAAFATFRRLAEQGDVRSQNALAHMYFLGESVPQDYASAARWFDRAANQGNTAALASLADLHIRGLGVEKSTVEAYKWYMLASLLAPDEERRTLFLANRDQVARGMSADELERGRQSACHWWQQYRAGPPDSRLGRCGAE